MRPLHMLFVAALAVVAISFTASAQEAQRFRGEVIAKTGNDISIKTPEGKTVNVTLGPAFTVNHTVKAKLSDIKPGDYVGTGAYPSGDTLKAAEVHIFLPGTRPGEGHRPWGSDPNGTMTNADVTATVANASKDQLTLTTNGNSYKITVTPDTPIVRFTKGEQSLVKTGAWVGISNAVQKDGKLTAQAITVSDDKRYPVN
jgi:hypothetical protein